MSTELKPSRNYPGRTALHHKTYADSNMTTILDLTPEDVAELRRALATPITTVEELDALPDMSIVSRNAVPYIKHYGLWYLPASEMDFTARSLLLNNNATLIYNAEEES
jgi:hypothetical protein